MFIAHSSKEKDGIPVQSYSDHVNGVISRAGAAAKAVAPFSPANGNLLIGVVARAAEYHDLGKLAADNQDVLSGRKKAKSLPIQHTDAGTAHLLEAGTALDAVLVRSHHIGLPDFVEEQTHAGKYGENNLFRDMAVADTVDVSMPKLLKAHWESIQNHTASVPEHELTSENPSLFFRLALSCLADGDHTDTAIHYGQYPAVDSPVELKPAERLNALDSYVSSLGSGKCDDRSQLRQRMYAECRDSTVTAPIASCDSPVGSGKTTAVMAHLLKQAKTRKLRRIIVVLPFTNIISQSAEVYRKALTLPGENPDEVVAELHHRADFQSWESRYLTALWKAPIIVTTAVAFFETLASNTPSTLRRLHNLPGSAIFVDESHAALPAKLLPVAWDWMKALAHEWSCYWVLASGSLNRFWRISEFDTERVEVPEIISESTRAELNSYEQNRVIYKLKQDRMSAEAIVEWAEQLPGPRILILNTVQSAAVIARAFERRVGRGSVEHLSTALSPADRKKTLEIVKKRLYCAYYKECKAESEKCKDCTNHLPNSEDTYWTLVATSCVEAGVDISFRTGIREQGSLVSLLQTAGRVNRHGGIFDAEVWTIRLVEDCELKQHQGLKDAVKVLGELFEQGKTVSPDLCTQALQREIRYGSADLASIRKSERQMRFPLVEKMFKVIDGDTRPVVVDVELIARIERYEHCNWRDIQNCSVQVWGYKLEALRIPEFPQKSGLYKWNLAYDSFLGYMSGILDCAGDKGFLSV